MCGKIAEKAYENYTCKNKKRDLTDGKPRSLFYVTLPA